MAVCGATDGNICIRPPHQPALTHGGRLGDFRHADLNWSIVVLEWRRVMQPPHRHTNQAWMKSNLKLGCKDLCKCYRGFKGLWKVMGDGFVVHQAAVVAFYKEEAIGLHSSQHGPTWPTRLPWTGHTMRHPLPAHFYCHSPPGPHEDGGDTGGRWRDRDTSWHSPSQHLNLREERTARALFSRNLDWWTAVSCDKAELGQTCRTSPLSWLSFISCCCS